MKILFVNYHHLDTNSGIHIFNLANSLTHLGVECTVCVPQGREKAGSNGKPYFRLADYDDVLMGGAGWDFDLVHFWTPREIVRKFSIRLFERKAYPYVIHLEDNESHLAEKFARLPLNIVKRLPDFLQGLAIPDGVSHPVKYREFLEKANGITLIIDTLKDICPQGIPLQTIWAGYQEDLQWDIPPDTRLRRELGIREDESVVVYTGNVHSANSEEVAGLYRAVWLLDQYGLPARLLRTGTDYAPFLDQELRRAKPEFCIELGHVPREMLPSLLSIADVLVQPGAPGPFNDYRFPSKIPEYLASGKPVVLPRSNIGNHLQDEKECLLLESGDALDIFQKVKSLLENRELRGAIGNGGKAFAKSHLRWSQIAETLHSFYLSLGL